MNLREGRRLLLNLFGSSKFWTPWNWVKCEWLCKKKSSRIWFLSECKCLNVLPNFITNRIRTADLDANNERAANARKRYAFYVFYGLIRQERQEKITLKRKATLWRKEMSTYSKSEYLQTKKLMENVVSTEALKDADD